MGTDAETRMTLCKFIRKKNFATLCNILSRLNIAAEKNLYMNEG